jgi:hypothetical protein
MSLRKIGCEDMNWIKLTHSRVHWQKSLDNGVESLGSLVRGISISSVVSYCCTIM